MMENEKLLELFVKAELEGFVNDINDYAHCIQECEECPAAEACEELSAEGSYKDFKRNFDERVRPLL